MNHTPESLAAAFADAPTGIHQRQMERSVTLHEDDRGTTAAVLSVRHDRDAKVFTGAVRIVLHEKREGPFNVTTWLPLERTHNRRLPPIPVSRYSDKALAAADTENLEMLAAEPEWLGNLDLGPYGGDL